MRICAFSVALKEVLSFGVLALFFSLCSTFSFVHAQEETEDTVTQKGEYIKETITSAFSVSPIVANEKAKPRDIIKKELLVTNNTQRRMNLYISVENVDPADGSGNFSSPAASDLSTSLANWIEITRGVIELSPGESRKIPYLIHVNLTARPGNYYARIQFREGSRRAEAEANKEGTALMLSVEVYDDAKERLELGKFVSEDNIVLGNSVSFAYMLENVGNRDIEPRGSIRIFNRRGEEVGNVPLNAEGEEITPLNKRQLATAWNTTGRFGKYKAFLDLEYGENQLATVQDTVYFWVFPWKEIFASLAGVLVLAVVGTYIVHMRSIAQPANVRMRHEYLHAQDSASRHRENHCAVVQGHAPSQGQVTVLSPKRNTAASQISQRAQTKQVNKKTETHITLNEKPQTKVQGNVVHLPKRR